MSSQMKVPATECDKALPPPPNPPHDAANKQMAEKSHQTDEAKKPQDIKSALTIMSELCAKAMGMDGSSYKTTGQWYSTTDKKENVILGSNSEGPQLNKVQSEKKLLGEIMGLRQIPKNLQNISGSSTQSTATAPLQKQSNVDTLLFAHKNDMNQVDYDQFYETLMSLDEGTLDEIIQIIVTYTENKPVQVQANYDQETTDIYANAIEAESDTKHDDNLDYELASPCKKPRRTKAIDYNNSRGFKNFFKLYKKKNCDKPCDEILKCAKEAYKNLSPSSKSRYRNLNRKKPACPPKRKRKPKAKACSDSDSYDD